MHSLNLVAADSLLLFCFSSWEKAVTLNQYCRHSSDLLSEGVNALQMHRISIPFLIAHFHLTAGLGRSRISRIA